MIVDLDGTIQSLPWIKIYVGITLFIVEITYGDIIEISALGTYM
jgi:hypothetical protein